MTATMRATVNANANLAIAAAAVAFDWPWVVAWSCLGASLIWDVACAVIALTDHKRERA